MKALQTWLIGGLILNSPWLDLQGRAAMRSPAVTAVIRGVGITRGLTVLPQELSPAYGDSIHESRHGEWKYNLELKPLGGFPVTFGWIRAIRNGHALLQAGLDVAPNVTEKKWTKGGRAVALDEASKSTQRTPNELAGKTQTRHHPR